ncbi:MAG: glycosyltransferase family 2 protein [Patescibacteria group bacterium]|mgnify:CR=1 FL=1
MKKISAIIIAKNEESMIKDAIESVLFCDEIIVVDNGSVDKTKEIAQKYAKVYDFKSSSFADLRNFGLSKVEFDYVLYLDTDERISEELKKNIRKVLSEASEYSAFRLLRKNYYLGENEWPYVEKLERLFKKDKLSKWKGELHESPIVDGKIGELDGYIFHFTHRDLESMLEKTIKWSTTESLLRYNTNHPQMTWWRFPRVMISAFLNSYVKQRGYKAGTIGIIESIYQAFSAFITYAKLWELQNRSKIKNKI